MCTSEKNVSHPFGHTTNASRIYISLYECEINIVEISIRAQTWLYIHNCIFFLHFFLVFCLHLFFSRFSVGRHLTLLALFVTLKKEGSKRKEKKISSTVLLLFLNPLALSITCWVRECETSFSDFRIFFIPLSNRIFLSLKKLLTDEMDEKYAEFFLKMENCWNVKINIMKSLFFENEF